MKRILSILLTASVLLCPLAACGRQPTSATEDPSASQPSAQADPSPAPELSAVDLAETVLLYSGCEDTDIAERINAQTGAGDLDFYIENAYQLDKDAWEEAAVIRAAGASAFEVAVLRFSGEAAAAQTAEALKTYQQGREGDFTGYAPAQADMVHNGVIRQQGSWVGLFLCPDPEGASSAFLAVLEGEELPALPQRSGQVPPQPPAEGRNA